MGILTAAQRSGFKANEGFAQRQGFDLGLDGGQLRLDLHTCSLLRRFGLRLVFWRFAAIRPRLQDYQPDPGQALPAFHQFPR